MSGTREGSRKVTAILLSRNPNHFSDIGKIGGKAKRTKPSGFAAMPREKVVEAARKGGKISKRRPRSANKMTEGGQND